MCEGELFNTTYVLFKLLQCTHFWENEEQKMLDFGPWGWVKYIIWDDVKSASWNCESLTV